MPRPGGDPLRATPAPRSLASTAEGLPSSRSTGPASATAARAAPSAAQRAQAQTPTSRRSSDQSVWKMPGRSTRR